MTVSKQDTYKHETDIGNSDRLVIGALIIKHTFCCYDKETTSPHSRRFLVHRISLTG